MAKLSARHALLGVSAWALIVLLTGGLCLTAVLFFFYGVAEGLGLWLQNPWLGYLITGAALLFLVAIAVLMAARSQRAKTKRLRRDADLAGENFKTAIKGLAPLEWTREHPWRSTGAAAAAGFVVAGAVTASSSASEPGKAPPAGEPSVIISALLSAAMSILTGALTPIFSELVGDFVKELNLSEVFGVNLERRAQDAQDDGAHQQADRPEDGQPAEDA